ncbi:MAG: hypothetical protein IKD20_05025 [Clostridia bacterium]|nr:hypothetical protein [Clostridia bacterium]
MSPLVVAICFFSIALMRVIQNVCSKSSSMDIKSGDTFFRYSAYYYLIAGLFSLVTLSVVGFHGLDAHTILTSLVSAILFGIGLYAGIEAIKGCTLIVSTMFGLGGLVISCGVSYFWFGEGVSAFQIVGLFLFMLGVYLLTPSTKSDVKRISLRTYVLLFIKLLSEGLIMVAQKYFALFSPLGAGANSAMYSFLTFIFNCLIMLGCLLFIYLRKKKTPAIAPSDDYKPVAFGLSKVLLICGLALAFALFVINLLVTEMSKSVDSILLFPISSAISIFITTLIGWIVFKEKLTPRNFVGLIIGLISIIVIGMLTPDTVSTLFGA